MNAREMLEALVRVDSTSSRSNADVLAVLDRFARMAGFATWRQEWTDAAGLPKANLICRRGEGDGGLAFVGHSDCVPFDAGWTEALAPEVRAGKLYGRGAADTKSFCAAALAAAARTRNGAPLWLVFTADEEVGCLGARKLVEEGKVRPRFAVVGEPTQLVPILGHKGYCLADVIVTGAEGHSAYPETGASAILAAGRMLREIEAVAQELEADRDETFAPPFTTVNVGVIGGGKAKNIIPGECRFTLEWRPVPGQDPRRALGLFEAAARRVSAGEIRVEVRAQRLDAGVLVARDSAMVRFVSEQTGNDARTIPFGTELPYLVQLGAEACVFGPGDIRVAHRTGEYVPLDDLDRAEAVLSGAVERFANG